MTDFWLYTKACVVSSAAFFVICGCIIGVSDAMRFSIVALVCILAIAAFSSLLASIFMALCSWRNKWRRRSN